MKTPNLIKYCRDNGILIELHGDKLGLNIVKENVDESLIELIKEKKEEIINYLTTISQDVSVEAIPKAEPKLYYPITSSQFRFWILCQIEAINQAYNLPIVVKVNGDLQLGSLKKAAYKVIERHEVLRTRFVETSSGEIAPTFDGLDKFTDVFNYEKANENSYKEIIDSYVSGTFDLKNGPLFRIGVVERAPDTYYFYFNIHHIISDARSLEILIKELFVSYNGIIKNEESELPVLNIQHKDYVEWYNNNFKLEKEEEY